MLEHLAVPGLSFGCGAILAAQDIPGLEIADRVGLGAIAVVLLWWMLGSFSKRLDRLTDSIDRLTGHTQDK